MGWKDFFIGKNSITDMGERYPRLDRHWQTSIPGIYVAGNLACVADIKAALNQSYDLAQHLLSTDAESSRVGAHPTIIIGGGPAGLNIASELHKSGKPYLLLERKKALSTIHAFQKDLILYNAKTGDRKVRGDFSYAETTAGHLLEDWWRVLMDKRLNIREGVNVLDIRRIPDEDRFEVTTDEQSYSAARVVIATGKLIALSKITMAEEIKTPPVSPGQEMDARLLGSHRIHKEAVRTTEMPDSWLKTIGIRYENDWKTDRVAMLVLWATIMFVFYTLQKFPSAFAFLGSGVVAFGGKLSSWYPILYSIIVVVFGTKAILRYRDRLQTRKYLFLMFFQVMFYCVIPLYVLHNWRAYSLAYPWPLVYSPSTHAAFVEGEHSAFYLAWVLLLTFVALPVWTLFTGKKYCSWICGCGGLAETLGDAWRHYSPKGPANIKRERAALYCLIFACVSMILVVNGISLDAGFFSLAWLYKVLVDLMLASVIPLALYPFLGGKIWCRYWCPTMSLIQLLSKWYTRNGKSRYAIYSRKDRCIACNFCTRYCEVGIDVRSFALSGKILDNANSSCVGCGICLSVCPTDTLSFIKDKSTFTFKPYEDESVILARLNSHRGVSTPSTTQGGSEKQT